VRRALAMRGLAVAELSPRRALAGQGVVAGEGDERVCVGSRALLDSLGVRLPPELLEAAGKGMERGQALAFVARGERALGVLALEDAPRADAQEAVARLRALGVRSALVTGDHAGAARLAARRAGIGDAESGVSPEGKVARVLAEQRAGARVLAVGDGSNDAAALATADVGIAFARGADVPLHAADVVVRAPRLGAVPDAIELARATLRRIRQGLAIAVAYNAVAVPLAAFGVLQPLSAAVAMSLSSLVVTANALRPGPRRRAP
jgi:Cu+-exporting ATPase